MTNIKLSFEDFPNVCRLCSAKKDTLKLVEHLRLLGLLDVLKNITNIMVESKDDLPNNVCDECTNKLQYVSSFIDLCIKSEACLREILEKHNIELCSQIDDLDEPFSPLESDLKDDTIKKRDTLEDALPVEVIKLEKLVDVSDYDYVKDKAERHSTKRQPSKCEICTEHFESRTKLDEHKKKNTSCRTREYKCANCDKAFFTNFKLNSHMRSHTKETPYECKMCPKKFRFAQNLSRHVDFVHKGLKPFKCDICEKKFSRLQRKIQHENIHTNNVLYKCKYCGKNFTHKLTHRYHETGHEIKNGEAERHSQKECDVCHKIFPSKAQLRQHVVIHKDERKFLCSICGKNFLRKSYLENHSRTHTNEKPFECKECGKRFKYASCYTTHTLVHTGERGYKCDVCSRTFKQSAHLKSHHRIHSGERPFKCGVCGKGFSQNGNLKAHTRIHTGETPYRCSICDKGFYDSSSMKKHEKSH